MLFYTICAITGAIKTIKTVDALITDQKTEGRKEGYADAVLEYKPVYSDLKKKYDKLIADIESKRTDLDVCSDEGLKELVKLEKERDRLKVELNNKAKDTSAAFNVPISSILSALNSGSLGLIDSPSIWKYDFRDSIIIKKKIERMQARKEGYIEAKVLYEEKMQKLKSHYKKVKADADAKLTDYANRVSALLDEIEKIKLQIADLKIAMGD